MHVDAYRETSLVLKGEYDNQYEIYAILGHVRVNVKTSRTLVVISTLKSSVDKAKQITIHVMSVKMSLHKWIKSVDIYLIV